MAARAQKNPQILQDIYEILEVDPDGKKFDKVSRIKARGDLYEMDLVLDMNVDLYPVAQGEKLSICLATTLNVDGSAMLSDLDTREQLYDQSLGQRKSLMDNFDYVMTGRVFKYKDSSASGHMQADVYISYGGLLMQLTGDPKRLEELDLDMDVYLLIKKV